MDVLEFRPSPDQYAWTFGGAPPVATVKPGTLLKLWTEDAFAGKLRSTEDLPSASLQMPDVNPQTGPFHVVGAEPGDVLAVHFVDIEPARDWAASSTIPLFGGLTGTDRTPTLQPPLPERTWIYQLDRARGTVAFEASDGEFHLELPIDPMHGTVGVAPPAREVRSALVPDTFGGNMDTPEMRAGVTCFLTVNVEGALFSIGDGHFRQGEGESCGTAVEGAMNTTLLVELIKAGSAQTPAWPRIESDTELMVVGSARPLEDAWRASQVEMVRWLSELLGIDQLDAYQLLTQISLCPLANVCDTNFSAVTKVPKSLLPPVTAFGGMHTYLREQAATL
ncbi:acetamidase/formamidase family protein [Pseudonocardia spinosispora]|uniref:acetamidase/formamidase family protein n=1 Tax=Pseudonocardia spinosispora TaxID=103441 RepID=UPI00041031BA|nr:acetamidase/formamidase family protein [Pseudonocardia spinosispora]